MTCISAVGVLKEWRECGRCQRSGSCCFPQQMDSESHLGLNSHHPPSVSPSKATRGRCVCAAAPFPSNRQPVCLGRHSNQVSTLSYPSSPRAPPELQLCPHLLHNDALLSRLLLKGVGSRPRWRAYWSRTLTFSDCRC